MSKTRKKLIVVIGPTASGKTSFTVKLAEKYDGEIISADSRQVYCGLDIGSGKDIQEYRVNDRIIPYHLIDIVDPSESRYSLKNFCIEAKNVLKDITERRKIPFLAGGTVLYINALLDDYELSEPGPDESFRRSIVNKSTEDLRYELKKNDPVFFKKFEEKLNRRRIERALEKKLSNNASEKVPALLKYYDILILGVLRHRKIIHKRIEKRLDERLENGMIEEVEKLRNTGVSWKKLDSFGLEYRFVSKYIKGELSCLQMREQLLFQIRKFAKRQDIWFRKMERAGKMIHWIENGDLNKAEKLINDFLAGRQINPPQIKMVNIKY